MRPTKRLCLSSQYPLYLRTNNALDKKVLSILVNEAKRLTYSSSDHATAESKCFCFNACVKWNNEMEPEIIHQSSLLSNSRNLSLEVQNASLELIKHAGKQTDKISKIGKTSWIAFELIRIPLDKKIVIPHPKSVIFGA